MAVKLSTFLGTALDVGLNSDGVVDVVTGPGMAGLIPLDSNTAGNYIETIADGGGLVIAGVGTHGSVASIRVDSSEIATLNTSQTLTNKTFNLTQNTLTGTLGQFNAALSGASFASIDGTETLTNKTLTSPTINSPSIVGPGSITKISTFSLRDTTTTTYNTLLKSTNASPTLSADRTLTLDVNNADRTISLTGNLTLAGSFTTQGSGSNDIIVTTNGATSVTLPTSGTLVSVDGSGNTTISGTITAELDRSAYTSVTPGEYGSATQVPIVTVDSNGFVDSISETTLTGVTSVSYNTSNALLSVAAPNGTFSDTITLAPFSSSDLAEGTNLYHTTARVRAAVNVVDAGGDGSFAYDSSLGKFTYTGPSASDVRAHFSAGEGVTITNGVVAIAQAVDSTEDVAFGSVTTTGNVVVGGDLTVQGTTTTLNTATLDVEDINITIAKNAADSAAANGAGFTVDGADATILYNHSNSRWDFNRPINATSFSGNVTGTVSDISNHSTTDLSEGDNLYYTATRVNSAFDTRLGTKTTDDLTEGSLNLYYDSATTQTNARSGISVTDNGGDGSLSYSASTGVISYTGPSATEVRAHISGGLGIDITSGVVSVDSSDITYFKTAILNAIKLVDGPSSGLDADLLDGQEGSYYRIDVYNSSGTLLN